MSNIFYSALFRYLLVGLINLGVCVMVMALAAKAGMSYLYYTPLAYGVAMLNSYILNGLFTFRNQPLNLKQLTLFFLINGLCLVTVECLEFGMIEFVSIPEQISILLGMVWYTSMGYVLNQRVVYATRMAT